MEGPEVRIDKIVGQASIDYSVAVSGKDLGQVRVMLRDERFYWGNSIFPLIRESFGSRVWDVIEFSPCGPKPCPYDPETVDSISADVLDRLVEDAQEVNARAVLFLMGGHVRNFLEAKGFVKADFSQTYYLRPNRLQSSHQSP